MISLACIFCCCRYIKWLQVVLDIVVENPIKNVEIFMSQNGKYAKSTWNKK